MLRIFVMLDTFIFSFKFIYSYFMCEGTMKLFQRFLAVPAAFGLIASFTAAESFASPKDKGLYGTIGAGLITTEDIRYLSTDYSVDEAFTYEAGLGYRFNSNLRTEVTYVGNSNEVNNSSDMTEADTKSFLLNAYYDFSNDSKWTPYIGGGIGSVTIDTDASTDKDDNVSTAQGKLGVTYNAGEKTDVFGEIVRHGYAKSNIKNVDLDAFGSWKFQIGMRYFF